MHNTPQTERAHGRPQCDSQVKQKYYTQQTEMSYVKKSDAQQELDKLFILGATCTDFNVCGSPVSWQHSK